MVACQEMERGSVGLLLGGGGSGASREGILTMEGLREENRPWGLRWLATCQERGRGAREAWQLMGSGFTGDNGGVWREEEEEDGGERDAVEVLGKRRRKMKMVRIMD